MKKDKLSFEFYIFTYMEYLEDYLEGIEMITGHIPGTNQD